MAKTTPGKLQRSDELFDLSPNVVKLSSIISTLLYTYRENVQRFPRSRFSTGGENAPYKEENAPPRPPLSILVLPRKMPFFQVGHAKKPLFIGVFSPSARAVLLVPLKNATPASAVFTPVLLYAERCTVSYYYTLFSISSNSIF